MSVLIVGAGCTGAATAYRLREKLGAEFSVHVWEKARGAGGRYTTAKDTYPDGLRADMGAQYASVDPDDEDSVALMKILEEEGDAELMSPSGLADTCERPEGSLQYRGVQGQNGIVKAMLRLSKAQLTTERRMHKLDTKGGSWVARARDDAVENFSAVIMCVPGCGPGGDNLNKIHGNWEQQLSDAQWRETTAAHDCRFSLALWLAAGCGSSLDKTFDSMLEKQVEKAGGLVEFMVWQSKKDGEPLDGPQVVVVHTIQGVTASKHQAESRMTREALQALGVPQTAITSTKLITWFQSQVQTTRAAGRCLVASEKPPLVLAGDYFTSSTFTGCVQSAYSAADAVASLLQGKAPSAPTPRQPAANKPKAAGYPSGPPAQPKAAGAQRRAGYGGDRAPGGVASGGKGGAVVCSECRERARCFLDKSDGKRYCAKCWKAYYGAEPPAGAA